MNPTPRAQEPLFSASQFRQSLSTFATGVTVVTATDANGNCVGLTANSFNSVSLTPPLVLWSLSRQASCMAAFAKASHYAIHVLAADQQALAERFATKSIDRFAGTQFTQNPNGAPILDGALAVFECFNRSQYEEGDHVIFVGEVERCQHRQNARPLIYHGGKFFTEL
jgi:flavin reductase (DIM6/NTAB) family NADH-FMN oxidoreductase RutF